MSAILDAIPLPALIVGADDRITQANALATALFGRGLEGRSYVTMLRQPALLDCIERTLKDRQPLQTQLVTSDGTQDTSFHVTCRYFEDFGIGQAGSVLVCFQDLTPTEEANRMRRDFIANVSHELRTPLTAMIGFIETLQGPASNDAKARDRFLSTMQTEAARMNRLVDDLLSLSHVEDLQRQRPTDQVDLIEVLTSTCHALMQMAARNEIEIKLDLPQGPVVVTADMDQLRQVFINLIENAIKYGGHGNAVTLKLSGPDHSAALRCQAIRIHVIDHGPGIDPRHLPRLTERFYRADAHRNREQGGTGLGLAIVKHILNRHRGRLRIESEMGQGTTVTVILPV